MVLHRHILRKFQVWPVGGRVRLQVSFWQLGLVALSGMLLPLWLGWGAEVLLVLLGLHVLQLHGQDLPYLNFNSSAPVSMCVGTAVMVFL